MNDHGFSKACPSGNHMIDGYDDTPDYGTCDICNRALLEYEEESGVCIDCEEDTQ